MSEWTILKEIADLTKRVAALEAHVAELIAHPGISKAKEPPAPSVPRWKGANNG